MFLIVGDIARERQRLRDVGISLGDDIQGNYSTLAQGRDPDSNQITLATPPSPHTRWHDNSGVAHIDALSARMSSAGKGDSGSLRRCSAIA